MSVPNGESQRGTEWVVIESSQENRNHSKYLNRGYLIQELTAGDRRDEKPNRRWWSNPKISSSRKLLPASGWRNTGKWWCYRGRKPGATWRKLGPQRKGLSGGQLAWQRGSVTVVNCHQKQKKRTTPGPSSLCTLVPFTDWTWLEACWQSGLQIVCRVINGLQPQQRWIPTMTENELFTPMKLNEKLLDISKRNNLDTGFQLLVAMPKDPEIWSQVTILLWMFLRYETLET